MAIDLDTIQSMWEKDSKIDPDNLHTESLNIPRLHAKYYDLHNQLTLLRARAENKKKVVRKNRHEYYTGKADPDVYVEDPFPKKIRDKETLRQYLDADETITQCSLKVEYYDVMLRYLEDIIKTIHNRTYQIKNAIEYQKFVSGMG
jgi:hypothetical protein